MKNVLNTSVSFYKHCSATTDPTTVPLLDYLQSAAYRDIIETIRKEPDKMRRNELKRLHLPGITPSGIFTRRAEEALVQHSGLIAGDIDFKDNPFSPDSIKKQLSKLRNIAYCGLSASGMGLWFLVPISDPTQHKPHFAALMRDFMRLGIRLDPAPANVASFRFYSYDPDAYFNPYALVYHPKIIPERTPVLPSPKPDINHIPNTHAALEAAIRRIEQSHTDIAPSYHVWFRIGCALANAFGEDGRLYFHRISQQHSGYTYRNTDHQFSRCLRWKRNRIGLGTVFYWLGGGVI